MSNFPNPFNPGTTIRYSIANASHVTLKVYDIRGREVATLVDGLQQSGAHTVPFNGSQLASGFYLYRLEAAGDVKVGRMLLMK